MFGDGSLTFQEFITREPHPLAVIHDAVLDEGPVAERLRATGASALDLEAWRNLVAQEILPEDDDDEFPRS